MTARIIAKVLVRIILIVALVTLVLAPWQRTFADSPAEKAKVKSKREEAARLLQRFDGSSEQYGQQQRVRISSSVAELVGSAALPRHLPDNAIQFGLRLYFARVLDPSHLLQQDEGPPDLLFAAIATAREAIRADVEDAEAHVLLGEVYHRLASRTRERAVRRPFILLDRMRRIQMAAAWNRAIQLRPDAVQAHAQLATLYQEMGYLDLMRKHFRRVVECTQAAGPAIDEDRERFDQRLKGLKDNLKKLDKEVDRRLDQFKDASAKRPINRRAGLAVRMGLPAKALEILLASDVSVFGADGARMELELLLITGRIKEVREWLRPRVGEALGPIAYPVLELHRTAAEGDYDQADKWVGKLQAQLNPPAPGDGKVDSLRSRLALLVGKLLLDGPRQRESMTQLVDVSLQQLQLRNRVLALVDGLRQQADLFVLRGLLAMEQGSRREAAQHFRAALEFWQNDAAAVSGKSIDFSSRTLAQHYLLLAEKIKENTPARKK